MVGIAGPFVTKAVSITGTLPEGEWKAVPTSWPRPRVRL
jgi:hypothetical protein